MSPEQKADTAQNKTRKRKKVNKKSGKQHFFANNRYFTISIYVIVTFCICLLIFKIFNNWSATEDLFSAVFDTLMPFFLAFVIAYFINPIDRQVNKLLKKLFKTHSGSFKITSLVLSYVIFIGVIILLLIFIIPQIAASILDLAETIPYLSDNIMTAINNLVLSYPNMNLAPLQSFAEEYLPDIFASLQEMLEEELVPQLSSIASSIVSVIIDIILAFVISAYMMGGKKNLKLVLKRIIYALFSEKTANSLVTILRKSNSIFSSFIIGKAIDSLIIGILCFILMNILRLPYTVLVSVIVGVTNMIPYFGPFIGAIPGAILMLLDGPIKCLVFLIMILCLQQFDGNILGPRILGDSTGLKPIWIIFAITVGGAIGGVLGMFLGVPIVAVIAYLINTFEDYRLKKQDLSPELAASLMPQENQGENQSKGNLIVRLTQGHDPEGNDNFLAEFEEEETEEKEMKKKEDPSGPNPNDDPKDQNPSP